MQLGHISEKGLSKLSKQELLYRQRTGKLNFCEHCVFGKKCQVKFDTTIHKNKGTMDYIYSNLRTYSDLSGPLRVPCHVGGRYMLTFIYDYSKKVWVFILRHKDEAFVKFKQWKALIEK